MTRLFTLLILISSSWIGTMAQTAQSDEVRGTYWNAEKTSHIRIYRAKNGKYYGKIEYLKEPNDENGNPKTDPENPDKELRSRSRLGMVIMNSFSWSESESRWQDGTIYDPVSGNTYDGYMYFKGENHTVLYLRGYMLGMTWLGRTSEWTRVE
tara:strand:- start:99 stop:557 length:459 start_codon:yes stop_codon:yes gene_type:complete